jgi:hypothetical protein
MEISENEKTCNYSIWTRRPIYNCSRISRASRASLIPINRPLTFEEKYTQALRKNQKKDGLSSFYFLSLFIYFLYVYNFSLY